MGELKMKKIDYVSKIIECCQKREEILINDDSIGKYNRYFDRMMKYARKLIDENRHDELLPYLESDSISIRSDIADILYDLYPKQCVEVLQEIANMTTATGLPKHFVVLSVSAQVSLKYVIPKSYP